MPKTLFMGSAGDRDRAPIRFAHLEFHSESHLSRKGDPELEVLSLCPFDGTSLAARHAWSPGHRGGPEMLWRLRHARERPTHRSAGP